VQFAGRKGAKLRSLESSTVTFVITIWVDPEMASGSAGDFAWRGEIRNVMRDQKTRTTFAALEEIAEYIRPYLEERGVAFPSS
jgi:hypothetical protein